MQVARLHEPGITLAEAKLLQARLANDVQESPLALPSIRRACGVDVSSSRFSKQVHGAAVTMDVDTGQSLESASATLAAEFPYVPGYLAFREAGPILASLEQLTEVPDVLLVDGNGRMHPRLFGVACYLGLATGIPTIGCAKSFLCGEAGPLPHAKGSWSDVRNADGLVIGRAVRTRDGVKPVYVSIGHRIDLDSAAAIVLHLCHTRIPQPIRLAHDHGNTARRRSEFP